MTPKAYEQLSLLERVLYHEIFDGQDQDIPRAVPYSLIQNVRHSGWICTIDGRMLNPDYFHLAPLAHHLDFEESSEDTALKVGDRVRVVSAQNGFKLGLTGEIIESALAAQGNYYAVQIDGDTFPFGFQPNQLEKVNETGPGDRAEVPIKTFMDEEIFDGQAGDAIASPSAIASKFGEYWIEHQYKTIKGKQYGPYIVQRWRDENGRKRSRYLGKAPTTDGESSQQQQSAL